MLHIDIILKEWRDYYPSMVILPVVEKCEKSSFLCSYPLKNFEQESKVPVLIGMNTAEGGIFASRKYSYYL